MLWPNVIHINIVGIIPIVILLIVVKLLFRYQAQQHFQGMRHGFQVGYRQCCDDHQTAAKGGEPVYEGKWTRDQLLERLASEYFRKGQAPPARDWLILDRRPNLLVDNTAAYERVRFSRSRR